MWIILFIVSCALLGLGATIKIVRMIKTARVGKRGGQLKSRPIIEALKKRNKNAQRKNRRIFAAVKSKKARIKIVKPSR